MPGVGLNPSHSLKQNQQTSKGKNTGTAYDIFCGHAKVQYKLVHDSPLSFLAVQNTFRICWKANSEK